MEVGVNAAIILEHIDFWCAKNRANGRNFNDGYYWTYNSTKAFVEIYPYMSEKAIRTALGRLEDGGYIVTGRYNEKPYDRTKWYAITEKGSALLDGSICPKGQMDTPERADGCAEKGNSHNINNSYKPVSYPYSDGHRSQNSGDDSFTPPTVDEVKAYADEFCPTNGLPLVNANAFCDYYAAQGWVLGNNIPMYDWKAAVRKWANNSRLRAATEKPADYSKYDASKWERG